jgi:hypothetical protein
MGIRITTSKFSVSFGAMLVGLIVAGPATAQTPPAQPPPSFRCANIDRNPDPYSPQLKPIFRSITSGPFESEFDCLAWQDFIYLMWPAQANQRGVPDPRNDVGDGPPPNAFRDELQLHVRARFGTAGGRALGLRPRGNPFGGDAPRQPHFTTARRSHRDALGRSARKPSREIVPVPAARRAKIFLRATPIDCLTI